MAVGVVSYVAVMVLISVNLALVETRKTAAISTIHPSTSHQQLDRDLRLPSAGSNLTWPPSAHRYQKKLEESTSSRGRLHSQCTANHPNLGLPFQTVFLSGLQSPFHICNLCGSIMDFETSRYRSEVSATTPRWRRMSLGYSQSAIAQASPNHNRSPHTSTSTRSEFSLWSCQLCNRWTSCVTLSPQAGREHGNSLTK